MADDTFLLVVASSRVAIELPMPEKKQSATFSNVNLHDGQGNSHCVAITNGSEVVSVTVDGNNACQDIEGRWVVNA